MATYSQSFIEESASLQTIEAVNALTLPAVFRYRPICEYMVDANTREQVIKFVAIHLGAWQTMYNVVRPMSAEQIIAITEIIVRENTHWRLADYALFFRSVKQGRMDGPQGSIAYPKLFDRIDLDVIREHITIYELQRSSVHEMRRQEQHRALQSAPPADPEFIGEIAKALREAQVQFEEWKATLSSLSTAQLEELAAIEQGGRGHAIEMEILRRRKEKDRQARAKFIEQMDGMDTDELVRLANDLNTSPAKKKEIASYLHNFRNWA